MAQVSDYSGLITSEHSGKPKFKAMVEAVAGAFSDNINICRSIVNGFDLDIAVGDQLDAIGEWVGLPRIISVPLAVYFSLDVVGLGFDQGNWKGPYDPSQGLTSLDDETYRTMIRAKIGANNWNGTLTSLQSILSQVFASTTARVFAADHQDMSMSIFLAGYQPPAILQSLLKNGYLPLKPEGVKLNYIKTSVNGTSLFGFDLSNQYIAGFDAGAWGVSL